METFVARQPIFDINKVVVAYELLYRDSDKNYFNNSISSSKATSILLANSYFSIGIENLTFNHRAFINFDKKLIENDIPMLFNRNSIVVELLEDIKPDANFINKIKKLKLHGYTIALDDFTYNYPYEELIELCDIIKVDFLLNSPSQIQEIINTYKKEGRIFVAEKIETHEIFSFAKKIGYDYFQGYFFSRPNILEYKSVSGNSAEYINILEELNTKEPSYNKISKMIERDLRITYKLLKLVNSKFVVVKEINSVKHALAVLGIKEIEKWVTLLMIQDSKSSFSSEIIKSAIFRSKFGELLAENSKYNKKKNELVLLGLLSVIDILLNRPMEDIVKDLPLTNDIKNALLGISGPFSNIYDLVCEYEKGSWEKVSNLAKEISIPLEKLPKLYFEGNSLVR